MLKEHIGKRRLLLTNAQRRRLATKAKTVGRRALLNLSTIVTPDTLMRWYRKRIASKYDGSRRRGPGRPRTPHNITALVVRLAIENPGWGYTRIRGILAVLGRQVGRTTIARILADHGIDPAPRRPTQWSTFLKAHWGAISAADFSTVEVLTPTGLSRRHALFVIDLQTRAVEIASIVAEPLRTMGHERGAWPSRRLRRLPAGQAASHPTVIMPNLCFWIGTSRGVVVTTPGLFFDLGRN